MSKNAVIWSQEGCSYCESAKVLLVMRGWEVEEKKIGVNTTKQDFLEANPGLRSVPQIYINGRHVVNGYVGLKELLG